MGRYEIIQWDGKYNIADNNYLNVVLFDCAISKRQAKIELSKLGVI